MAGGGGRSGPRRPFFPFRRVRPPDPCAQMAQKRSSQKSRKPSSPRGRAGTRSGRRAGSTGDNPGDHGHHGFGHDRDTRCGLPQVRRATRNRDVAACAARRGRNPGPGARERDLPFGHHLHGRRLGRRVAGRIRTRAGRGGHRLRPLRAAEHYRRRRPRARLVAAFMRALRALRGGKPDPVRGRVRHRFGPASQR